MLAQISGFGTPFHPRSMVSIASVSILPHFDGGGMLLRHQDQ
jgi:hypothetical protein